MLYGINDEPGEEYDRLIFDAVGHEGNGVHNTCGVYLIRYGKMGGGNGNGVVLYKIGMSTDLGMRLANYGKRDDLVGQVAYLFCESKAHALSCEAILKSMMEFNASSRKWKGREYFAVEKNCLYKGHELSERLFAAMAGSRYFDDSEFVAHCLIHHHPHSSFHFTARDFHWMVFHSGCNHKNLTRQEWEDIGAQYTGHAINYHSKYSGRECPDTILTGYRLMIDYMLRNRILYDIGGYIYHWIHAITKGVEIFTPQYDDVRYAYLRMKKPDGQVRLRPKPLISDCCPYYMHYALEVHRNPCFKTEDVSLFFNSLNEIGIFPQCRIN